MEPSAKPVFYSTDPSRWKRFLWVVKIGSVILLIGIFCILFSLFHKQVFRLPSFREQMMLAQNDNSKYKNADLEADESAHFRKLAIEARNLKERDFYKRDKVIPGEVRKYLPVRAGFYVNWDIQARYSLNQNASKMNMVLPEWLFIQDTADVVATDIDLSALEIMRRNHLAIVPMVSNYFNNVWNGKNVHRIISSPERRTKLINSLITVLDTYKFNGVNIDFEELTQEKTDENLVVFMKELHRALHRRGYLVTQDIAPFNEDYNVEELAKYNDFLFLMGYDQHNSTSRSGPVAAQDWLEAGLSDLCKKVPSDKVVLCFAAFGYDWQDGFQGEDVTYQEAISTALESEGQVKYDNNTYNLDYTYYDDNDKVHQVYFADAATAYNAIRTASDFETSGVAFWRLGSEDPRIWKFYNFDLSEQALKQKPFNIDLLEQEQSSNMVDYVGAGEILNIISVPHPGKFKIEYNQSENLVAEEKYESLPSSYVIDKVGEKKGKIVLTFDDGPDERYTPRILDILSRYKVPAVFFVTGINAEENFPLVRRLYREGHEIGNHTFLHPNLEVVSEDRLKLELRSTGYIIESITGHATTLFRPPYNTDAEPTNPLQISPIYSARKEGYLTIGSSIDPRDWEEGVSADTIVARAEKQVKLGNIILMHDAGGDREQTVKALPRIIEFYKRNGYQFVSLAQLMGKKRDDLMPPVTGSLDKYLQSADATVFRAGYYFNRVVAAIFFVAMLLSLFKIKSIAVLAIRQKIRSKREGSVELTNLKVSIIVPGYNEEITAPKTVENLLLSTYPDIEIVFVDDGSKDNTYSKVSELYGGHSKVKVLTKPNGGKASALNYGISQASGEILVCIDADTVLHPEAITRMVAYFSNPEVAAVAGNVKVGNRKNLLTRWQSIEYITS